MKLRQIGLLAILCLPLNLWAPEEMAPENSTKGLANHQELSKDEQGNFEKELAKRAQEQHYKNDYFSGIKTLNYSRRANNLDNDIKKYMINSSKINELHQDQLNELQNRLREKINKEKGLLASKGLRDDLLSLEKNVTDSINQKNRLQNIPDMNFYYSRIFNKNIKEFSDIQGQVSQKEGILLKLQNDISSRERDLLTAEQRLQDVKNKNNNDLASAITANNKTYLEKLNDLKQQPKSLNSDIKDLQDRINFNKEDTDNALVNLLKNSIPQEQYKKLSDLLKTVNIAKFSDIDAYIEAENTNVSDKKIKAIKEIVSELESIDPSTKEIQQYVNFLKNQIKNHFLNLENEAFRKYTEKDSEYLKIKLEDESLQQKIHVTKRISGTDKQRKAIEKSKEFIKQLDEDVDDYQQELEKLQKNPTLYKNQILEILYQIKIIENEKKAELKKRGFDSKDIENYENLANDTTKLEELTKNLYQSAKNSAKLWELKTYFADEIKKITTPKSS